MVVQVKKEGDKLVVNSSNEQAAISVVFPVTPSVLKRSDAKKIPAGTITKGFVALATRRLNSIAAQVPADNKAVKESIAKSLVGLQELSDGLDAYTKNSKSKIILSDVAGNKVEIGSDEVAWLDAFYSGFLGLAEERQLLTAREKSFSPVPVAQAAETACTNNWETATDPVKIINLQLDCLYNKIVEPKTDGSEGDNWENKSLDIMQSLSLGFSTDGFGVEKQIAYAVGGYLGPLNPPMTRLIKPVGPNVPFLVIMALGQLLITSNDICSALPDYCYRRDYTIADPFNLREFLFLKYDIDDSLVYRFETPEQFNNFMYGSDDYDAQTLPKADPVADLKSAPAPVSSEPIKYTVPKSTPTPKPTPTPSPTPSPTPAPDEPVCAESRDTTYNKCLVFCESKKPQQATLDACYASCSSATDKLVCENACRADWFSALSASSSCFSSCLDAYSASKCY